MIYIYDVLLNWFKKGKIMESFEWNTNDEIDHVKKIPLIRVDDQDLYHFLHYDIKLDLDFFTKLYKKTEVYDCKCIRKIDYAMIISNGKCSVALKFNNKGYVIGKSKLLLDEEEEVLEMTEELTITRLEYEKKNLLTSDYFMTRHEYENKNFLIKELKYMVKTNDLEKIDYLYEEYFDKENITTQEKYQILLDSVTNHYSKIHEEMVNILKLTASK